MNMATSQILEKLDQMEKRFDKIDDRFSQLESHIDKRFEKVDKRFEEQKAQNHRFALKFGQVDRRFENFLKKMAKNHNEVMIGQDKIMKKVKDIKQEYIFSNEHIKRLDK